ncbi:hypothetical protein [Paenibacillus eucommiae]|uniref:YjzC family protein n=1 Tax=Paenibacillus eucommiae TaxID=1355755 RepID=A0ABS4J4R0_9BACL|nr:hypothetical protein [Paenibacillus eucommiae]MBP1994818.1 hypothetical protein [Paenibacillus eucommiae]
MMKTPMNLHRTKETVPETGTYICEQGESKDYREGELFANCPISNEHTTWRHADHVHKSGQKVTESGKYEDADGEFIVLKHGDVFPDCPKSGEETTWRHA